LSALTAEENEEPEADSAFDKKLKSRVSFASSSAVGELDDDERITVVQVGERERNFNDQQNGKHMKPIKDKEATKADK